MGPIHLFRTVSLACLATTLIGSLGVPPALARVWTNTEGQTLEAEFVRVRGRDVLLKTEERTLTAPINRLVQEDRDWIERHRELTRSRLWGKAESDEEKVRGQFLGAKNGKVRLKYGSKVHMLPYDQISADDWRHVDQAITHLGEEMPEDLLALKPVAPKPSVAVDLDAAVERTWTDAKGREIVAKYLGNDGPKVRLWMREKEFLVPLARFSEEDRAWVAKQNLTALTGSFQQAMSAATQIAMRAQMNASGAPPAMRMAPPPGAPPQPTTVEPQWDEDFDVPPGAPPRPGAKRQPPTLPEPSPAVDRTAVAPTPNPPPAEPVIETQAELAQPIVIEGRGAPPWIDHFDDLTFKEKDQRYRAAFGDWVDTSDRGGGETECSQCEAYFIYPASFTAGDPCPYCGVAFSATDLQNAGGAVMVASAGGGSSGSDRPWYLRRWFRRLAISVVVAGIGVGVKLGMGGGEEAEA